MSVEGLWTIVCPLFFQGWHISPHSRGPRTCVLNIVRKNVISEFCAPTVIWAICHYRVGKGIFNFIWLKVLKTKDHVEPLTNFTFTVLVLLAQMIINEFPVPRLTEVKPATKDCRGRKLCLKSVFYSFFKVNSYSLGTRSKLSSAVARISMRNMRV